MKKRLLLILTIGVCFSPSLFADVGDQVGPFQKSAQASAAGASFCAYGNEVNKNSQSIINRVAGDIQSGGMTSSSANQPQQK